MSDTARAFRPCIWFCVAAIAVALVGGNELAAFTAAIIAAAADVLPIFFRERP